MDYVSIDIETTGLDPAVCGVLQVAAVRSTGEYREWWIDPGPVVWESEALKMHLDSGLLFTWLMAPHKLAIADFVGSYRGWLGDGKVNYAGKNVAGFDMQFLRRMSGFPVGRHRILDVGCLYVRPEDECIPDLAECLKRAGREDLEVIHWATDDALAVHHCIQAKLR